MKTRDMPHSFDKVELGSRDYEKAEIVQRYDGLVALAGDTHHGGDEGHLILGVIEYREGDAMCYDFVRINFGKEDRRTCLHYHDLSNLLVDSEGKTARDKSSN